MTPDYFIHNGKFYPCVGTDEGKFWAETPEGIEAVGFEKSECTQLYESQPIPESQEDWKSQAISLIADRTKLHNDYQERILKLEKQLEKAQQPIPVNQDGFFKDIFDTLLLSGDVYQYDYKSTIESLKLRYSIQLKSSPSPIPVQEGLKWVSVEERLPEADAFYHCKVYVDIKEFVDADARWREYEGLTPFVVQFNSGKFVRGDKFKVIEWLDEKV